MANQPSVQMNSVEEFWTDRIEEAGVVRRIFYRVLLRDTNGNPTWHYFGTTVAEQPPPNPAIPVITHTYVQLPQDIVFLGEEANWTLYELGQRCGLAREGLA